MRSAGFAACLMASVGARAQGTPPEAPDGPTTASNPAADCHFFYGGTVVRFSRP
jgi:hypothetical protein